MDNLTPLVIEYKKTKDPLILNKIFNVLNKTIWEKANYIFKQELFNVNGHYFKLSETKKVELGDVINELNLEVLKLIEKFDVTKSFDTYFYSTIWNWKPNFINNQFMNEIKNTEQLKEDIDDETYVINDRLKVFPKFNEEIDMKELIKKFRKLTKEEKKVLHYLKKNPNISQQKLAKKMKVSKQWISQIFEQLRKKYKNNT